MSVTQQITGSLIGGGGKNNFKDNLVKALDKVKGWTVKLISSAVTAGASMLPQSVQEKIHNIERRRQQIRHWAGRDKE